MDVRLLEILVCPVCKGPLENRASAAELVCKGCKLEESLKDAKPGEKFQFVRTGFFTPDSKNPGVYNRVVTLRDSFKPAK